VVQDHQTQGPIMSQGFKCLGSPGQRLRRIGSRLWRSSSCPAVEKDPKPCGAWADLKEDSPVKPLPNRTVPSFREVRPADFTREAFRPSSTLREPLTCRNTRATEASSRQHRDASTGTRQRLGKVVLPPLLGEPYTMPAATWRSGAPLSANSTSAPQGPYVRPPSTPTLLSSGSRAGERVVQKRREEPELMASITVIVESALTGCTLTTVTLPSSAPVATLKHRIECATGKGSFSLHLIREQEECCTSDFDTVATALSCSGRSDVTIRLSLVVSQLQTKQEFQSLPFHAVDRDYLPASGLVSSALGSAFPTSDPWPQKPVEAY